MNSKIFQLEFILRNSIVFCLVSTIDCSTALPEESNKLESHDNNGGSNRQLSFINSEDSDLTSVIIQQGKRSVVNFINTTERFIILPGYYDSWIKQTFVLYSRTLRDNFCTTLFIVDVQSRRNYFNHLQFLGYRSRTTIYFIHPDKQTLRDDVILIGEILRLDNLVVLIFLLENQTLYLNPTEPSFESIQNKGNSELEIYFESLHRHNSRNRMGTCINGRSSKNMKCENLRYFLTQPVGCFIPDPTYIILGRLLNSTMIADCPTHSTSITQAKGFKVYQNMYKNFVEKTVDNFILYCYSKPTIVKMVFTKFITTIGWSVWLYLFCIVAVVKHSWFKLHVFDMVTVFLRQTVTRKVDSKYILILVSVMTSFIAFRYDAIITSFTASPPVEERVEKISHLFNVKKFKVQNSASILQNHHPNFYVYLYKKQFQILSINLSKIVLIKDLQPKASLVDICWLTLIRNFADRIAFIRDQDLYRTELNCLNSQLANMTCTTVSEKFNSQGIVWHITGFGSLEIFKSLSLI